VLNGPRRGKLYRIKRQGLTIGRAEDNDIILEDETVSRHHARLLVEMGIGRPQVYIQDLASVNGVLVNGERVVRRLLEDEDRIAIGETLFAFKHL
jgi:pSer/pThr/pTyr-binding forkhead associated (FHA) protein